MASGYEAKRMRIIKTQDGRGKSWAKKALRRLDEEFGAEEINCGNKRVGVELDSGKVICKKKTFKSVQAAESVLTQIALAAEGRPEGTPSRAYQCQHCNGWHLTSHAATGRNGS